MRYFHKQSLLLVLTLFIFGISGCAGNRPMRMPVATVKGIRGHFFPGQIIALPEARAISFEELVRHLQGKRLVFVGEVHDNAEDHLIEVQILQALLAHKPRPDVAMEFFQVEQQQAIDRYFQGKTSETQFLKEAHWRRSWGFPYRFYRPLVLATKEHDQHLFAINVPRKIVQKVARKGLNGLSPRERNYIARHIDLTNRKHRAFLKKVFNQHAHGNLSNFEYFYQAQCVWEDTMAEH
ncbi:MAG: ChaN family lipoprotein, partial [Deltaproteobacteria bacterium]|nr:ChaN family lipoprotein [Deltaproteobacteria bacterium]